MRFVVTLASGKTMDRTAFVDLITITKIEPFEVRNEVVNAHGDPALELGRAADCTNKFTWAAVNNGAEWRGISKTFSRTAQPK